MKKFQIILSILLILLVSIIIANLWIALHYLITGLNTCASLGYEDCDKRKDEYF